RSGTSHRAAEPQSHREKERQRERETESRRGGEMGAHFLSVSPSLRLSVPPSPCLCVSVSLWHSLTPKVVRFDLEVELRRELDNAWIIRRGEAGELTWRYRRIAFDADVRKPQRIEDDRIGYGVHFLEVGPVEQIEGVEDELDPERAVSV